MIHFAKSQHSEPLDRQVHCETEEYPQKGTEEAGYFQAMNSNEIEAANRAEATAILIRAGYRVYRPEADVSGEDLVVRTPDGELRLVQMKSRPTVELRRYGGKNIWMLFPQPGRAKARTPVVLYQAR